MEFEQLKNVSYDKNPIVLIDNSGSTADIMDNRTILKNALANNTPFIQLKGNIPKETYGYATSILRPKND